MTTWTLETTSPPAGPPGAWPGDARLERVVAPTPELVRFVYAAVGGPWRWTDRLGWTREQWASELAVPGTEVHLLLADGAPQGYVELQPAVVDGSLDVEIRYFGLIETAFGRGWGRLLLEHAIALAWSLPTRHELPPPRRVWVHTCSLDGAAALANYQARGFRVVDEAVESTEVASPLGAWAASTGLPA